MTVTLLSGSASRQDSPCSPRASTSLPHTQVCGSQALEPLLTYLLSPIFKFYIPGMFYMGTPLLVPVRLNFVLNFIDVTESQYCKTAHIFS